MEVNYHIREYLRYYLGFEQAPRYAVLLSGPWGSGKTYQAKKIVAEIFAESAAPPRLNWLGRPVPTDIRKRYILVSLYGLRTPQEIDDAMVTALYPWSGEGGVRIAASVGRAVLKHAKIELPAISTSDLVSRMNADLFIFDDLERCRMPVTDALGYINQLVERDGCKVVIIANELELAGNEEYRRGKEKLIGKTLAVSPDFDAAFSGFSSNLVNKSTADFCELHKTDIEEVYGQSGLGNLRILQQTMWDFDRVYAVLSDNHRSNVSAMTNLVRLFFALSFEHKAGLLETSDFIGRREQSLLSSIKEDAEPSRIALSGQKYVGLYLTDTILSDSVLVDLFAKGLVDGEAVRECLDQSSWFVSSDEPSWRTVWYAAERGDSRVESAAKTMILEFEQRRYLKSGEILHLFGQMLWLSDMGFLGWDRSQTLAECKGYIDDLRKAGKLEPLKDSIFEDFRFGSFGGLGFAEKDTPEFHELWAYLGEQRSRGALDRYPEQAQGLAELMARDSTAFSRQIAHSREGAAEFAQIPVFSAVDPDEFADKLIMLEPLAFREVMLGFTSRYDMGSLSQKLSAERDWAESLEQALIRKATSLDLFARDRITKNVEWTLGKTLREYRESEREQSH